MTRIWHTQTMAAWLWLVVVITACGRSDFDDSEPVAATTCSTLSIASVSASAEQVGNPATNAIDGNLGTRWSAQAVASLTADLGSVNTLCSVSIAWYRGNVRRSSFSISVSTDGAAFTTVFSGSSSGTTTGLERYDFPDGPARFVRVTVTGNTENNWASITELTLSGVAVTTPTASFTFSPSAPVTGQTVHFDATSSTCSATPCTYSWTDEPAGGAVYVLGTGLTLDFVFMVANTKYVNLVVTDATGASARTEKDVVVTSPTATAACSDGIDNDGDGKTDFPADPGCSSTTDTDEADAPPSTTCNLNATPSNFGSQVAAAQAGQTICLATGNYGTWQGTNKAITIRAATGASPSMNVNFGSGAFGFTLDGMVNMSGLSTNAHDFTIRNSTFTDTIELQATNANILLDHNSHDWFAVYNGGANGKIIVWNSTGAFSGVTVSNSTIRNGDLDGVHLGAGINILSSVFTNLCDVNTNHTDNIQWEGGTGGRVAGNYFYASPSCSTQGVTSYDGGTVGVTIEDNVIDIHRPWGIELYADKDSVVRHNTLRWRPDSECDFTGIECGQIALDHKPVDPAGSGTQVYDNITTTVSFSNGSTGTAHHNVSGKTAIYVGPLDRWSGFKLAPNSPVGIGTASDGLNNGARIP